MRVRERGISCSAQYPSLPSGPSRGSVTKAQWPPWRVMLMCRQGFVVTRGSRKGAAGTNGSSSAVMMRAGTRTRSITRIALAR
jgi:hypothetical protein